MRIKDKILRTTNKTIELVGFNVQFSIKDLFALRGLVHSANGGDEIAKALLIDFAAQLYDKTIGCADEDSFSITL